MSWDPPEGLERVGEPSVWSGMGRGTHSGRSEKGKETLGQVRDGTGDPRGGSGLVQGT